MTKNSSHFSITHTNDDHDWSSLPFEDIKEHILGKNYTLSLAFIDEETSQHANKKYRNKDYATDVLSFPLEENEGEILICPTIAKQKAPDFGYKDNMEDFILYLFIHGCTHLKGFEHGEEMEVYEKEVREEFGIVGDN